MAKRFASPFSPRALWGILKESFSGWMEDNAPRLGAALAYYTIFSLAPFLIIVISIAGLVFGQDAAQGEIMYQIDGLVGAEGAKTIQSIMENARKPATSIIASAIGIITLLVGATTAFAELQDSLNTIWRVDPKHGSGIKNYIRHRLLSFGVILGIGFLLLVSLVLSAALSAAGKFVEGYLPVPELVLQIVNFLASFAVITVLFAMIYKILPDATIQWRDVWVGAMVTSLLFTIGKLLIGLYLGKASVGSAYGAAGSVVIILLWVYYSVQIIFFGAEFTRVYADTYGSRVVAAGGGKRPVAGEGASSLSSPARA